MVVILIVSGEFGVAGLVVVYAVEVIMTIQQVVQRVVVC